ncbi:hypothetical protein BGZ61DRAFT_475471 [Ilyonectria robusta]|uniref:uncharacterized protein n=1 Tax=Ilyonectria robusta TaxID=1079257 RepID=UPI001E8D13CE|nr:uncharacterized protein BGZ61DRAFT_475471 [Ilyonectria robusta]KAH8729913.1 hypothetical protein BGZ61DRAFT_475471 [Ilyonectria robusta]
MSSHMELATCWAIDGDPRVPNIAIMVDFQVEDVWCITRWTEAKDKNWDDLASRDKISRETQRTKCGEPGLGAKLMRIRLRLASLQTWDTEIRRTALKLKSALQESAELIARPGILFDPKYETAASPAIIWSTSCRVWTVDTGSSRHTDDTAEPDIICSRISRVGRNWAIDRNQLEAVLGLWFWTLKSQRQGCGPRTSFEKVISSPQALRRKYDQSARKGDNQFGNT